MVAARTNRVACRIPELDLTQRGAAVEPMAARNDLLDLAHHFELLRAALLIRASM